MQEALTQLFTTLIEHFVPVLTTAITLILLPRLEAWLRLTTDDKRRAYLETALNNGLRLAFTSLTKQTFPTPSEIEAVRTDAMKVAAEYVKASVPNALTALKVSDEHLRSLLEARIPALIDAIVAEEPTQLNG